MEEPVRARPSPFGVARPREEVLAEKGVDWRKMETEIEVKKVGSQSGSRPGSSQSSRPGSPGADTGVRLRARVNPFGDAKPREVLLQEQGKDWRKMDFELEHRGVGRPETEEEKLLKDEINNLKKELAKEAELNFGKEASEEHMGLQELVAKKEKELELLIRELDDKVRFGQRGIERTGSAASGFGTGFDRPPSRPGTSEGSRSMDLTERPRSRGAADLWTRAGDDRRGRERGFLGSRDSDSEVTEVDGEKVGPS
ncbi:hypothetical protein AMTR_s00114p00018640 [Amborella trichopoda]|uniref:Uncharacterized protein n=1 Tax=Amborella trichopoda TaxID=13333 RepID=W1NW24_AMBTC|nr:hypothetical protein AMTR_s00114p00018640 [Amborella trichopoda]